MKKIALLGSTGSIGRQTLEVIARHPDRFTVVALAAGTNETLLLEQSARFRPQFVSIESAELERNLRVATDARVGSGAPGLTMVAAESGADLVVAATDGAVAFEAVFAAVERGIDVAVANKELVVAAGELLFEAASRSKARLLPVDSEHSALFQCLAGEPGKRLAHLILTASGGPFWERDVRAMQTATLAEALRHPTWDMGAKNTVDSATLMNKGLEVIEASRFFGLSGERISVVVHRQSIVHGFAVFSDGNVKAQLAPPDMRLPIGYALAYPDRLDDFGSRDPLSALGFEAGEALLDLRFERPDPARFPALTLAYNALGLGKTAPAALSAANEVAVEAFIAGAIAFGEIAQLVESAMRVTPVSALTLQGVRDADRSARAAARSMLESSPVSTK